MRWHLRMASRVVAILYWLSYTWSPAPLEGQAAAGAIVGQVQIALGSFPKEPAMVTLTTFGATVNSTYTDNEGRFAFTNLSWNAYHLIIQEKDYLPVDETVVIDPTSPVRRVNLRLMPREKPKENSLSSGQDTITGGNPYLTNSAGFKKLYPTDALKEFKEGVKADQKHKVENAITHYQKAIALAPNFYPARNNLGTLYLGKADYAASREQFERVIEINPTDAAAYFNLGNVYLLTRQYEDAERLVEQGLKRQPESAFGHFLRGSLYAWTGDAPRAETSLRRSLELDPKMAQAHLALVNLFIREGKHEAAIAELKTFLKTFPEHNFAPKARIVLKELEKVN
ncbi:MAG: tetratricopeptide repeat protein [Terriglobales bacterium]